MEYVVKDVGKPPRTVDDSTVAGIYGSRLSIKILNQKFVTGVTLADEIGHIVTTITKKGFDDDGE